MIVYLKKSNKLTADDKFDYRAIKSKLRENTSELVITDAIRRLCELLYSCYGKKAIVLLDEYDTPLIESYVNGFWNETVSLLRLLFNSTFKTNKYLHRAVITGITRVSKESMFSDLNNLELCTMSANKYQSCFGFTEDEVFSVMNEYGYTNKDEVKYWYDGFTIGERNDIYNPWSIVNFLDKGKLEPYWSNSSSNSLVNKLLRESDAEIKEDFEALLKGEKLIKTIDNEMVFSQLSENIEAIWSLLSMSGYLKTKRISLDMSRLQIVNFEVMYMFRRMVSDWFKCKSIRYSRLVKSLLESNIEDLNEYMNILTMSMISYFDAVNDPDDFYAPEKFYHGFVLGLLVELREKYVLQSNRESGIGRYDIMLIPKNIKEDKAFIMEFKVVNKFRGEKSLEETLENALKQIEDRKYEQFLLDMGISNEKIVKYGFAFEGKRVLVGMN